VVVDLWKAYGDNVAGFMSTGLAVCTAAVSHTSYADTPIVPSFPLYGPSASVPAYPYNCSQYGFGWFVFGLEMFPRAAGEDPRRGKSA
jgi:hypothetical protein